MFSDYWFGIMCGEGDYWLCIVCGGAMITDLVLFVEGKVNY